MSDRVDEYRQKGIDTQTGRYETSLADKFYYGAAGALRKTKEIGSDISDWMDENPEPAQMGMGLLGGLIAFGMGSKILGSLWSRWGWDGGFGKITLLAVSLLIAGGVGLGAGEWAANKGAEKRRSIMDEYNKRAAGDTPDTPPKAGAPAVGETPQAGPPQAGASQSGGNQSGSSSNRQNDPIVAGPPRGP